MMRAILLGAGAIGSRVARRIARTVELVIVDRETVSRDNLDVSAFETSDVGRSKAEAAYAQRLGTGAPAIALPGEVAYRLRPGLVRSAQAIVLALDNPTAIADAASAVWEARFEGVVLVLACGGADGGYQVRVLVPPGRCPCCGWGVFERRADRLGSGTSCADTSAPRASGEAAEEAAAAGVEILEGWETGDRSFAGTRIQRDPGGQPYTVRLPAAPRTACTVVHERPDEIAVDLEGGFREVTLGELAARGRRAAGGDAQLELGRRASPLAGAYCSGCREIAPAPVLLLPAALAAARPKCGCRAPVRPVGLRSRLHVAELLVPSLARLRLSEAGAAPGDEFVFSGERGMVRVRVPLADGDLEYAASAPTGGSR